MFDTLVDAAGTATDAAAVGAWARIENAACARRLSASAEVLDRHYADDGSAEREQWILDNFAAVAAEVATGQGVSMGVAAHQLEIALALRDRLPRVNAVFLSGAISYRLAAAVVARTRLVLDLAAMANIDTALATHLTAWATLSVDKTHTAIDYWVDRFDPAALRRAENTGRGRHVDVTSGPNGSGRASIEASVFAQDGALIDARLEAMAAAVCDDDPRTIDQRRADAMAAVFAGAPSLPCACGSEDCAAAATTPSSVVIHVVATEDTLTDAGTVELDGHASAEPAPTPDIADTTPVGAPGTADPAYLIGGGGALVPAPIVATKLATTANIQPVVHPGDAPPEKRRIPSAVLAWFVRCRDLTCRFPGCDEPATHCDLDHTIPYPRGATQASNLKCLCRKHHLLKTFWRWRDRQHPDGTVDWTSPSGQKYTTYPGSRLLFPTLCRPTAPTVIDHSVDLLDDATRCLKMPRRKQTRAANRAQAITDERRHNQPLVDERHKPPPF